MSKLHFQRIILYARQHRANQNVNETLQRLIGFLNLLKINTFVDEDTAAHFNLDLPILDKAAMSDKTDLIVVVGGDGSMLSAARLALHVNVNVPVIGINRGRLGFLTDISPQDIESELSRVLAGHYREEMRFLLNTRIYDEEGVTYYQGDALNDVVLARGNETHLVEFDITINQEFVSHHRADGLIVATPTGSTAYALSAGGPIMHPELNAIVVIPMFSHSLSSRPLVIDGQAKIDLKISEINECDLRLSCDGHESHIVKPNQHVAIEKNERLVRLLHPSDHHYYDTLRIKLGWGMKP
ncbi:MAG: NAD(+) kinase [Legionellales bacterium]|nr:NAD(+) kinase [Legionellales bacterium]